MLINKLWGKTQCLVATDTIEVWHASIVAGGFSSKHMHQKLWNEFYVVSGELIVELFFDDTVIQVPLTAGMSHHVAPGKWHRFKAITAVELIEKYFTEKTTVQRKVIVSVDDIIRRDVGGVI